VLPDFITNPNPEIFLSDNYLVIDLETTTLDKGTAINRDNSLLLSVSKRGDGTRHVRWGNEYEHGDLLEDIQAADFVVAHNAKFELQWLQRCGLDLSEVLFFDTQIAEYVLQANRSTLHSLGLGKVSKRYGYGGKDPFVDVCMKAGVDTRYLPSHWLEQRCVKDVDQTEKIFIEQRDKLRRTSRLAVCFTRCLLTPVLADIEFNGMCLDGERTRCQVESICGPLNNSQSSYTDLTDLVLVSLRTGEVIPLERPVISRRRTAQLLIALNHVINGNASSLVFESDSEKLMQHLAKI